MQLISSAFTDGGDIPKDFTCKGEDISPDLAWSGLPEGCKSLALACIDHDVPAGQFMHWLVHSILAQEGSVEPGQKISGGVEVENDFAKTEYGDPCPPSGKHRYIFTLYALSVEGLVGVTKENFIEKVESMMIEKTELTGLYGKA